MHICNILFFVIKRFLLYYNWIVKTNPLLVTELRAKKLKALFPYIYVRWNYSVKFNTRTTLPPLKFMEKMSRTPKCKVCWIGKSAIGCLKNNLFSKSISIPSAHTYFVNTSNSITFVNASNSLECKTNRFLLS